MFLLFVEKFDFGKYFRKVEETDRLNDCYLAKSEFLEKNEAFVASRPSFCLTYIRKCKMETISLTSNFVQERHYVLFHFKEDEGLILLFKQHIPGFILENEIWMCLYYPKLRADLFRLLKGKYWLDYSKLNHSPAKSTRILQASNASALPPLTDEHLRNLGAFKHY